MFGKVHADPQSADKDQVVLLGNHRGTFLLVGNIARINTLLDAWVSGAVDPNSGR